MKKFISFILSAVLAFSIISPAFAEEKTENSCDCDNLPVVLVRGMDFGGLYLDYGTENEQPAFSLDVKKIIVGVIKAIGSAVVNLSFDAFVDEVEAVVTDIFKNISIDEEGNSLYNVSSPEYPESADNYESLRTGGMSEYGMARACIETFGEGHTYYVCYDWRIDPFVIADQINEAVEKAIELTGHNKVNLVCCSMGGVMTVAYLTKYGYEKINRCLFMSSTFCGAQVATDLLCGKVDITSDNLYNFVADASKDNKILSALVTALYKMKIFDGLTKITDLILDNYKDEVFQDTIKPIFGRTLTLWGLCMPENYEEAINYMLGGRENANPEFLKKTDRLQKMMKERDALLKEMKNSGVEIAVVAHYNKPVVPVYENSHMNGDGVLETYQMSGFATVAPYGKTLGDDYVAENPDLVSPDNVVDLSTALFPENTYIIKNANHVGGSYGTEYSDFFIWLLTYDGEFYAGANERYPQFMVSDPELNLRNF